MALPAPPHARGHSSMQREKERERWIYNESGAFVRACTGRQTGPEGPAWTATCLHVIGPPWPRRRPAAGGRRRERKSQAEVLLFHSQNQCSVRPVCALATEQPPWPWTRIAASACLLQSTLVKNAFPLSVVVPAEGAQATLDLDIRQCVPESSRSHRRRLGHLPSACVRAPQVTMEPQRASSHTGAAP